MSCCSLRTGRQTAARTGRLDTWTGTPRFFRNSLDWLVQGKELDNVGVKLLPTATLDINPRKDRGWPSRIRAIAIGAGPLLLLIVGLLVWLTKKRRRKWIVEAVKKAKKPVVKAPPKPPEPELKEEKPADAKDPDSEVTGKAKDDVEASPGKTDAKETVKPEQRTPEQGDEGARSTRDTDENPQIATSENKIGDTDENPIVPSQD